MEETLILNFSLIMIINSILMIVVIGISVLALIWMGMYLWSELKHFFYGEAPTISTYTAHYELMKENLILEDDKSLIDLGCGTGSAMRFFQKNYKLKTIDGVDNNYTAVVIGRILNKINHYDDINLFCSDIESKDISGYDYIYLFLLPEHLDVLQSRLLKNMKSDAIIICNTFAFSDWKPMREYHNNTSATIRMYQQ